MLAALLLRPFSSQTAWAAMPSLNACLLSGSFESELNPLEKKGAARADSPFPRGSKVIIANGLIQATECLGVRLRV